MSKARFQIGEGENTIVLSHWCDACHGEGKVRVGESDEMTDCGECEGSGHILTGSGFAVLEFVKKVMLKPEKWEE